MQRRNCLKTCLGAIVGLAIAPSVFVQAAQLSSSTVRRQLRFSIVLTNPRTEALQDQTLWLYMPVSESATQRLEGLKVSIDHELQNDSLGHSILKLPIDNIAPLASKIVNVAANVLMRNEPMPTQLASGQDWLVTERYIETSDQRIQALALECARTSELDTARAIYVWIQQNLQYAGYLAEDIGAREALTRRRGDCTEYAYLAVALARANGIPARMVGGYVSDHDFVPHAQGYHNWAEVYINGAWRLLDAQKGNWLTPAEQYIAFRYYRDAVLNPIGFAHRFKMAGDLEVRF